MYGLEEKCECPICKRSYETNPRTCACGFEGLVFLPFYIGEAERPRYESAQQELSFRIFKFAKQVMSGERSYPCSELSSDEWETRVDILEALEERGLALVDPEAEEAIGKPTVAAQGLLSMRASVRALVLNTTAAEYDMLDESHVESLLLGAKFKEFREGGLLQYAPLRYLWVDGKNKHFVARDNVLFDKKEGQLILYARARPGEEYHVPKSVKSLAPYSFFAPLHLKRLYLPRGIRLSPDTFGRRNAYRQQDGEMIPVRPEFEIIYE